MCNNNNNNNNNKISNNNMFYGIVQNLSTQFIL